MCKNLMDIIKNYDFFKKHIIVELILLKNQGFCNFTYLLDTSIGKYIIKKFEKSLHVNKKLEFYIQMLAYKKDIGPKPILLDVKNKVYISQYLEGFHKITLSRYDLRVLATALRNLHKIKIHAKPYNIERYLTKNNKLISKDLKLALLNIRKFKQDLVLCHNDLNPKNIIFADKIRFIDWEFASINDRYFDLASIVIEFNLNKKDENSFLKYYFKKNRYNINKIEIYKILYKHTCRIWFDKISQKG